MFLPPERVPSNKINRCGCANKNTRARVLRGVVLAKCVKTAAGTFSISKGVLFIFSLFHVFSHSMLFICFFFLLLPPKLRSLRLCNPRSLSQPAFVVNFFVVSFAYSFPLFHTHEKLFFPLSHNENETHFTQPSGCLCVSAENKRKTGKLVT